MTRTLLKTYLRKMTCPFCGGRLDYDQGRAADGKILPKKYQCRSCNRNPREALASPNPKPEGGKTMSTKKTTTKKKAAKTGTSKTEMAGSMRGAEVMRTTPKKTGAEIMREEEEKRTEEQAAKTAGISTPEPAKPEPKPTGNNDLVTFAFRLTPAERTEIHKAAGPGKASRFVKATSLAAARGDLDAIKELIEKG